MKIKVTVGQVAPVGSALRKLGTVSFMHKEYKI